METVEEYDAITTKLAFSMALGGNSPRDIRELVTSRENERDRLLSERDRERLARDN
jgi:hypothetical protein